MSPQVTFLYLLHAHFSTVFLICCLIYSGPNQESPYHELSSGIEILIGTTRFSIGESMTISEHDSVFLQTQQQKTSGSAEGKDNLHSEELQDKKKGNKFDDY